MSKLTTKVLEPKIERSPFAFFFRFFIGKKILNLKSNNIDQNFEFQLRLAFTDYCNEIQLVPETCYYIISDKPFNEEIGRWSYLKGVINLDSKGITTLKTPFKYDGRDFSIDYKNKKNQLIIAEENLVLSSTGNNKFFVLYYYKNPKAKEGKLLIDLTSGN
jgi:hypothetical protein